MQTVKFFIVQKIIRKKRYLNIFGVILEHVFLYQRELTLFILMTSDLKNTSTPLRLLLETQTMIVLHSKGRDTTYRELKITTKIQLLYSNLL